MAHALDNNTIMLMLSRKITSNKVNVELKHQYHWFQLRYNNKILQSTFGDLNSPPVSLKSEHHKPPLQFYSLTSLSILSPSHENNLYLG